MILITIIMSFRCELFSHPTEHSLLTQRISSGLQVDLQIRVSSSIFFAFSTFQLRASKNLLKQASVQYRKLRPDSGPRATLSSLICREQRQKSGSGCTQSSWQLFVTNGSTICHIWPHVGICGLLYQTIEYKPQTVLIG